MPFDFSVTNQTFFSQAQNTHASSSAQECGTIMGQAAAVVSSPLSLLADAAEELTFAVDTTKEFELEERKEKDKISESMRNRVKMYKDLMHEAGKSQKLDVLKDSIRAKAGKEHALREALRNFHDFTDSYVALALLFEEFEQDETVPEDVRQGILEAMQELEAEHGEKIRTGLHGAVSAKIFGSGITVDEARDLYRDTVCEFQNVNAVFAHIKEKYAAMSFETAMDFLFNAVSSDIQADTPSMEKTHLEFVHNNLSQVRLLQSAYVLCELCVDRWENVHHVRGKPLHAMELLSSIIALREINYLGAMHIDDIARRAKAPDVEHEVLFLQELMAIIRNFPQRLFDDVQGHQKVMDAAQQALDKAIEREDEYLAGLE